MLLTQYNIVAQGPEATFPELKAWLSSDLGSYSLLVFCFLTCKVGIVIKVPISKVRIVLTTYQGLNLNVTYCIYFKIFIYLNIYFKNSIWFHPLYKKKKLNKTKTSFPLSFTSSPSIYIPPVLAYF